LPRLRGAPLAAERLAPWVLLLYGAGVLLRVLSQTLAPLGDGATGAIWRVALGISGPLELAGGVLGVVLLARTAQSGPPLAGRAGLIQVLPLLVAGWIALVLALAVNAYGTVVAALTVLPGESAAVLLVPPSIDTAVVRLALLGWIVPIAIAFSARNFPLFIGTRVPSGRHLRWGLSLLLAGLLLDVPPEIGIFAPALTGELGRGLEGAALLWFTVVIGALGPKVQPPGKMRDQQEAALAKASTWSLVGAYVWLAVTGVLMLLRAVAPLGILPPPPPPDAERHALGAGFVFLLIVGMAVRLLPGFAGDRKISLGAVWAAVVASHLAALLRVGPIVLNWLGQVGGAGGGMPAATPVLAASGVAGMVAIAALAVALRPIWRVR
jgi:uncharacterized protein involved in response to NO